jgi:hypothetical protein
MFRFALAMRPRKKGEHYGKVVRDLLMKAKQHVCIDTVYVDSARNSAAERLPDVFNSPLHGFEISSDVSHSGH